MYEYIKGEIVHLTPTQAVLDNQGIGYLLQIGLHTYSALQDKKEVMLYTMYYVRDDVRDLYGFFSREERTTFELLIGVTGVGPCTESVAVFVLSSGKVA